jgi:glycosyltransferase involved in cell wall biosynthesis
MKPKYSLILPCWNERGALNHLFKEYGPLSQRWPLEVIFVDNGSSDGTAAEYTRLSAMYPDFATRFVYHRVAVNKGVGGGLKAGALVARGSHLVFCHADEQYGAEAVERVLRRYEESSFALVKGTRQGRALRERVISRGFDLATLALRRVALHDINAQPKCFPAPDRRFWATAPDDYCIDVHVLMNARAQGMAVVSVPVPVRERLSGQSSWSRSWPSVFKLSRRYVQYLLSAEKLFSPH